MFRDRAEKGFVSILERGDCVPPHLVFRNRVGCYPPTAGILIEIDAGISFAVQIVEAEVSQLRNRTRVRRSVGLTLREANVRQEDKDRETDDSETL